MPSVPSGHLPALDGLRGAAVLLVMGAHAAVLPGPAGQVGVAVFMVLSGFLITRVLLMTRDEHGRPALRRFWLRRCVRLLPALAVVLVVVAALLAGLGLAQGFGRAAAQIYVANWVRVATGEDGPLGHTWSLAVEEQFYLLWPLVLWALATRVPRHRLAVVCAAGAVLLTGWRLGLDVTGHERWAMFGTDTNAGALLAGAALAAHRVDAPRRWALAAAPVVIGVSLLPVGHEVVAAAVATVAATALVGSAESWTAPGALRRVGTISYGLYLWHYPLVWSAGPMGTVGTVGAYVLAVSAAAASYRWLEQPLLVRFGKPRGRGAEPRVVVVAQRSPGEVGRARVPTATGR